MADAPAYHTHPTYLALLAAVRANPADDLPRLVLADWLDESQPVCVHGAKCGNPHHHGATRADLIRRQCGQPTTGAEYRWVDNLDDHVIFGVGDLPSDVFLSPDDDYYIRRHWLQCDARSMTVQRGFMTAVSLPFAAWTAHAARILPESVGLTVRLTDRPVVEYAGLAPTWDGDDIDSLFVGAVRSRLAGADDDWHDGRLTSEDLLRRRWPDVAAWEVPGHGLAAGLVGAWMPDPATGDLVQQHGIGPTP